MLANITETDLGYNIVERRLTGSIDGVFVESYAVSGGRAGSKTKGVEDYFLSNNPYATHIKKTAYRPGGPIVMGRYWLEAHKSKSNWIRLEPFADNAMGTRDGFAIHGRGPRGSDGCIVPTDFHVVQLLCSLVKAREVAKKPRPTLSVFAIGDLDYMDRKRGQLLQTA